MKNSRKKSFLKFISSPFLGRKRFQKFFETLHFVALKGLNYGGGADLQESGEKSILNYIKRALSVSGQQKITVFDVGANVGDYSLQVAKIFGRPAQSLKIFAFEPSRKTFEVLAQTTKQEPAIELVNAALGETKGQQLLFSNSELSGLASLQNRDLAHIGINLSSQEAVEVTTLDAFCLEHKIEKIDFLKIDVEGYEYKVLMGAKHLLGKKAIRFIQFEFGGTNIDARTYFRDFYNLLSRDFIIYRIVKDGLSAITRYDEQYEVFLTTNFLAELKS